MAHVRPKAKQEARFEGHSCEVSPPMHCELATVSHTWLFSSSLVVNRGKVQQCPEVSKSIKYADRNALVSEFDNALHVINIRYKFGTLQ